MKGVEKSGNDATTEWISPFFLTWDSAPTWVRVLNPNPSSVKATVTLYRLGGSVEASQAEDIYPNQLGGPFLLGIPPVGDQLFESIVGWVYVESPEPDFPYGFTMKSVTESALTFPMTFYRAEGIKPTEFVWVPKDGLPDNFPLP